jgi:hypothetical protein
MVDFIGIGAQKGGTTWLYHQLGRHPQLAFPGGKEVHFWDRVDPSLASRWIAALEPATRATPDGRPIRSGEITPAYSTLAPATIAALRQTCPDVRLFISLRNPLARAWSAALMGLTRCQMEEHEASDQWFIDHFRSQASRQRGAYAAALTRWWDAFPREQLLVTLFDDIVAAPRPLLDALANHLRVDASDFTALPAEDLATVVVPKLGSHVPAGQPKPRLRPSLLPVLGELYRPEIDRLSSLLGRDLTGWLTGCDGDSGPAAPAPAGRLAVSCRGSGVELSDSLAVAHPAPPSPF